MDSKHPKQELYDQAEAERASQTQDVINSDKKKKVVVAGPGTGKTTLFQKILKTKSANSLTLTFINALVDDLSLSLFRLSEVRTLHGYALSILQKKGRKLFPKLPTIIESDYLVIHGEKKDFKSLFQEESLDKESFDFYKERKDYYGEYYGFSDIIYALVEYFKDPKNQKEVPAYDQVIVDEFQDFNALEVKLIELLAEKSPLLIAGDDDQSLYMKLKNAHPKHIRKKHGPEEPEYKPFPLDYCSRSTEVIVQAVNDFIANAEKKGFLKERVPKKYKYFPSEKMDKEGERHPKIIFQPVYVKFLSEFFEEEISNIAAVERKSFEVLIIVPNMLKKLRFPQISTALRTAGFRNIKYSDKSDNTPNLIDGLTILSGSPDSNLGWRIVAEVILDADQLKKVIEATAQDRTKSIKDILDEEFRTKVSKLIATFQGVISEQVTEEADTEELLKLAKYQPEKIAIDKFREDFHASKPPSSAVRGMKDIKITITTIVGSKGLAGDYVFLMDFSDKYFGKDGMADSNVYDFIVAMTRARKKFYLISPDDKEATFLKWIEDSRIERKEPFIKTKWKKD